jgi:hypothetical protein
MVTKSKTQKSNALKHIEKARKKLDGVDGKIGQRRYNLGNVSFRDFRGWANAAETVNDPDFARTVLFFGFQPLYDILIESIGLDGSRATALTALGRIVSEGTEYLSGYYIGEPKIEIINNLGRELKPAMEEINLSRFRTKFRNVDYNHIYPDGIASFLRQFFDSTLDGRILSPDYIASVACGPSEVSMPLAGLSHVGLGFIRRSHRRGDDSPKIIKEQEEAIAAGVRGKNVVVIEDYTCSAASLAKVMTRVSEMGPTSLLGASVNCTGSEYLHKKYTNPKFHLFELK